MKSQVTTKSFYFISLIRSQGGTSICAWPFQGSAVWLDGCLRYHLLQPLLHVRETRVDWGANQIRNIEKVTAVLQTTSYPELQRLLTFWRLIPMTKFVIRTDEAEAWILSFWQWSDGKWLNLEVCFIHSSVTALSVYNPVNRLQCHEWGSSWHKSERGLHLPAHCFGPLYYYNCLFLWFLSLVLFLHGI